MEAPLQFSASLAPSIHHLNSLPLCNTVPPLSCLSPFSSLLLWLCSCFPAPAVPSPARFPVSHSLLAPLPSGLNLRNRLLLPSPSHRPRARTFPVSWPPAEEAAPERDWVGTSVGDRRAVTKAWEEILSWRKEGKGGDGVWKIAGILPGTSIRLQLGS